jgi:copper(I)-binding protein
MVIVNGGQEADTLVGVKGEGFGGVTIQAAGTGTGAASPTTGTSASPTTGSATPTTSRSTGSNEIVIPANSTLFVDGSAATITLTDLKESLTVGQYIEVTLTFEKAGDVTLPVTVANPDQSLNRGDTFDFHPTEHAP